MDSVEKTKLKNIFSNNMTSECFMLYIGCMINLSKASICPLPSPSVDGPMCTCSLRGSLQMLNLSGCRQNKVFGGWGQPLFSFSLFIQGWQPLLSFTHLYRFQGAGTTIKTTVLSNSQKVLLSKFSSVQVQIWMYELVKCCSWLVCM